MSEDWKTILATVSGVALPLFNIPLIVRLLKRKSAEDMSVTWAIGVWVCIVGMTPQAFRSPDPSFRIYGYVNIVFFTVVAFLIVKYRMKRGGGGK